jgi:hypothetical protein
MGIGQFCQAEIKNLHLAARGDENIRRLNVAVNDSFLVRRIPG